MSRSDLKGEMVHAAEIATMPSSGGAPVDERPELWTSAWVIVDALRRLQGAVVEGLIPAPLRRPWRNIASGEAWRVRDYAGSGPPLLIVAAPIKQPYIWDLSPPNSAVARCHQESFHVYLLEWMFPSGTEVSAGLADYSGKFLGEAVEAVTSETGALPFLMGHSLGGTLAAIFAALRPERVRGLVLLASPLCFAPHSSRFRDAIVALVPCFPRPGRVVPGSMMSHLASLADPGTFVWSRLVDALSCTSDPQAAAIHARVERWALDEVPLSGQLVRDILDRLYRDDCFCRGTLPIGNVTVGPSSLRVPTLAVVNSADRVVPPPSVRPFLESMPAGLASLIQHENEVGVGLAHVAIVVGRQAHTTVWPRIFAWLRSHA